LFKGVNVNYTKLNPVTIDSNWHLAPESKPEIGYRKFERAVYCAEALENRIVNEIKLSGSPTHGQDVLLKVIPKNSGYLYFFSFQQDSGD
jgi:hypothetical protein